MNSVIMMFVGTMLFVAGLFASFIPPFFWGLPLIVSGAGMMYGGLFGTTVKTAKVAVAVGKEWQRGKNESAAPSPSYAAPSYLPPTPPAPPVKDYDVAKWQTLVEFDDDVKDAADLVRSFGQTAVDRLARTYLPVHPDKAMLQKIAARIAADGEAVIRQREEEKASRASQTPAPDNRDAERLVRREAASLAMLEELKASNMVLKYNGKRVVHAEMYTGPDTIWHGFARLVYEDGSKELRSGMEWVLG